MGPASNLKVSIFSLVGADDRSKLDAHLTAMRDVETRLVGMTTGTSVATCTKPTLSDVDLKNDDLYLKAGQMQMDLAVAALACDQTRILTFQWSYSESEHLFGFLGITGNHHAISHDFSSSGANYDAYNTIQNWYLQQFVYLLTKMDAYKEGSRSLLDNSVVLFATEIGESTQHDLTMMPYVLAGSAGGKFRTGRLIDYSSSRKDNNQLLVSLGQIMGASDLTSFGDPSGATGPLPEFGLRPSPGRCAVERCYHRPRADLEAGAVARGWTGRDCGARMRIDDDDRGRRAGPGSSRTRPLHWVQGGSA